jgi:hypothetical protein
MTGAQWWRNPRVLWAAGGLAAVLLVVGLVFLAGNPIRPQKTDGPKDKGDPRDIGREVLLKATTLQGYREGLLDGYNKHLNAHPGTLAKYQTPEDARLLQERFGLEPDELKEVQATTFQPLDAHHLELCFLLRQATRAMQLEKRPPLERARRGFDWVCRHVVLDEQPNATLLPPLWVLKRGQGSAQDRAVLFAALLHQVNVDVAMLALPEDGGKVRYWLPAVLVEETSQDKKDDKPGAKGEGKKTYNLYLFDTRLGMPLPGKAGVATLAELRKQPELLKRLSLDDTYRYDVTEKQLAAAEPHLICPLTALAPRMRFLEADLAAYDKVRLALAPAELVERFRKAGFDPVRVWNPPRSITPTRVLRQFLPAAEGGVATGRDATVYAEFQRDLPLWAPAKLTMWQLKLTGETLGVGEDYLRYLMGRVVQLYALDPREALQRGRPPEAHKRLERINNVLSEFAGARLAEDEFLNRLVVWRGRVKKAALAKQRNEPGGKKLWDDVWDEDRYLWMVLSPDQDVVTKEQPPRTVLSFLVFRALTVALQNEVAWLEAMRWHTLADHNQGKLDHFTAANPQDVEGARKVLAQETAEAWGNAQELWGKYTDRVPLTTTTLAGRLQPIQDLLRGGPLERLDPRVVQLVGSLSAHLQRELRQSAEASVWRAYCLEKLGRKQDAAALLGRLADQLTALQKGQELDVVFDSKDRKQLRRAWFSDFEPGGTYHWLIYGARLRQRQLTDK